MAARCGILPGESHGQRSLGATGPGVAKGRAQLRDERALLCAFLSRVGSRGSESLITKSHLQYLRVGVKSRLIDIPTVLQGSLSK